MNKIDIMQYHNQNNTLSAVISDLFLILINNDEFQHCIFLFKPHLKLFVLIMNLLYYSLMS